MDILIISMYVLFFIIFNYYAEVIGHTYFFSRTVSRYTYLNIILFTLICPLLYSSFSIGMIVYISRFTLGDVPMQWAIPILYIGCGCSFMIQPFASYYANRKIALYTLGVASFWLLIGLIIVIINPTWNNQLAKNLQTSFPSIGLFLMLTNLFVLVTICLYYLYVKKQNRLLEREEYNAEIK